MAIHAAQFEIHSSTPRRAAGVLAMLAGVPATPASALRTLASVPATPASALRTLASVPATVAGVVLATLASVLAMLAAGPAPALSAIAAASASGGATAVRFSAENENPIEDQGSNFDYRSNITAITPKVPGLSVEVLEFADRLLLRNSTGKTVTIYGYSGEPYARVRPDGAAELNVRAPAAYLNTNFYADVTVPPSATPGAPPRWTLLDRAGQFEWHDHRIHWMSPIPPPEVKDAHRRTKIFKWSVPIAVGAEHGAIDGTLYWVPESSKTPTAAIAALALVLLASAAFVIMVRRRRARGAANGSASPPEAW